MIGDDGEPAYDFERLGQVARTALRYLDRVVDINYYPTDEAAGLEHAAGARSASG